MKILKHYFLAIMVITYGQTAIGMDALAVKQKQVAGKVEELTPDQKIANAKAKYKQLKSYALAERAKIAKDAFEGKEDALARYKALIKEIKKGFDGIECHIASKSDAEWEECVALQQALQEEKISKMWTTLEDGYRLGGDARPDLKFYEIEWENLIKSSVDNVGALNAILEQMKKIAGNEKAVAAGAGEYIYKILNAFERKWDTKKDGQFPTIYNDIQKAREAFILNKQWYEDESINRYIKKYASLVYDLEGDIYIIIAQSRSEDLNNRKRELDNAWQKLVNICKITLQKWAPNKDHEVIEKAIQEAYRKESKNTKISDVLNMVNSFKTMMPRFIDRLISTHPDDGDEMMKNAVNYVNRILQAAKAANPDDSRLQAVEPVVYEAGAFTRAKEEKREKKQSEGRAERERLEKEQKEKQEKIKQRDQAAEALNNDINKISGQIARTRVLKYERAWNGKAYDSSTDTTLASLQAEIIDKIQKSLDEMRPLIQATGEEYNKYLAEKGLANLLITKDGKSDVGDSILERIRDQQHEELLNKISYNRSSLAIGPLQALENIQSIMIYIDSMKSNNIRTAPNYENAYKYGIMWINLARKTWEKYTAQGFNIPSIEQTLTNKKALFEVAKNVAEEAAKNKKTSSQSGSGSSSQSSSSSSSKPSSGSSSGSQPKSPGQTNVQEFSPVDFDKAVNNLKENIEKVSSQKTKIDQEIKAITTRLEADEKKKKELEKRIKNTGNPIDLELLRGQLATLNNQQAERDSLAQKREELIKELNKIDGDQKTMAFVIVQMILNANKNQFDRNQLISHIQKKGKGYKTKLISYIHPDKLERRNDANEATQIITQIDFEPGK